jgi:hypothetical protein
MNLDVLLRSHLIGLAFLGIFLAALVAGAIWSRRKDERRPALRPIRAFRRLGRAVGRAVEAGQQLHLGLGSGGIFEQKGAVGLAGLSVLERIARAASISDRPPVASNGESLLMLLSQDTLRRAQRTLGGEFDPATAQLTGVTPFSYAAGTLPILFDQRDAASGAPSVSANLMIGHFGPEAALIADAASRRGALTLAGSDNLTGQAVLMVTAQEPLIGEEVFASSAYMQAGWTHIASLRAQDIMRWVVIALILGGALYKFVAGGL